MPPYSVAIPAAAALLFTAAHEALAALIGDLVGGAVRDHSAVESLVAREGAEVMRRVYQGYLDFVAGRETRSPVAGSDGRVRTFQRRSSREMKVLFGTVTVTRVACYGRSQSALHPLDAELNLPDDLYSFGVRRLLGQAAARGSFDAATGLVEQVTATSVPKRQAEELARIAAQDFDAFYAARADRDPEPHKGLVVMSSDGKGVVVLFRDLRPQTRAAAELHQAKLERRRSKGEKGQRKRMATVGTVYSLDAVPRTPADVMGELAGEDAVSRPRAVNKRVFASLEKEPAEVIEDVFQEALRRDPEMTRTWVAVVDGNPTQLRLLRRASRSYGVDVVIVADIIHAIEYLWKAAWAIFAEGDRAAERWVDERVRRLLEGKASSIAAGLRRSATKRGLAPAARKPMDTAARYLLKLKGFMRYDEYLARGLPIASGVIEGACRHLVKDRMDITGARWSLAGAEAVLRLRSLLASGDLDAYWAFHERAERERNHLSRYAATELEDLREAA